MGTCSVLSLRDLKIPPLRSRGKYCRDGQDKDKVAGRYTALTAFCCIHQACQLLSGSSSSAVIHCSHPSKSLITSSHSTPLGLKMTGDHSHAITWTTGSGQRGKRCRLFTSTFRSDYPPVRHFIEGQCFGIQLKSGIRYSYSELPDLQIYKASM